MPLKTRLERGARRPLPAAGSREATCAGGAADHSGRSSESRGEVQEAALPTHPPARAACAHRVSAEFNYVYGRVLTRVLRAVRVMQPPRRHDPGQLVRALCL